jgi:3-mercaptopyruvate sulfurtransferase SseA
MKRPVLRLLAVFVPLVLVLAGCSSQPETTTPPTGTDAYAPPSAQELERQGFLHPELPRITAEGLKHKLDSGEPVVVVDTRLSMFYNGGHIPESINIPVTTQADLEDPPFNDLPKDREIVFYCD